MSGIEEWIILSTAHIAFPPDRKPVAEEIRASYEDHRDALIEAGESEEQASRLALEALGDPNEAGELLAKVHKPWLGWAWKVSRYALLAVGVALFITLNRLMMGDLPDLRTSDINFWQSTEAAIGAGEITVLEEGSCPEAVRASDYKIRVKEAKVIQDPAREQQGYNAFVVLQVNGVPWLGSPGAFRMRLQAQDNLGTIYENRCQTGNSYQFSSMTHWCEEGPSLYSSRMIRIFGTHYYWVDLDHVPDNVEWIDLYYDHADTQFSLRIDLQETGI